MGLTSRSLPAFAVSGSRKYRSLLRAGVARAAWGPDSPRELAKRGRGHGRDHQQKELKRQQQAQLVRASASEVGKLFLVCVADKQSIPQPLDAVEQPFWLCEAAWRLRCRVDRALTIGGDALYGQHFSGRIDEVRIFNTVRNAAEIQSDMNTPIGSGA